MINGVEEHLCLNIDTDGGNGDGIILYELSNHLHGKNQHRIEVIEKISMYLVD